HRAHAQQRVPVLPRERPRLDTARALRGSRRHRQGLPDGSGRSDQGHQVRADGRGRPDRVRRVEGDAVDINEVDMNTSRTLIAVLLFLSLAAAKLPAQGQGGRGGPPPQVVDKATPEIMNEDPQTEQRSQDRGGFPAHKIVGNLYYIGTVTLSSYLITTPQGNIVINSDYEETLPLMKKAIESLGFKMEDTKILLASHAHNDHQMGDAAFKQMTGAQTMFMAEDVPALQNMKAGGKEHPIDKTLPDGDKVELGGMTLTAHLTPGHTLGTTTWTFPVRDGGRTYNVVIVG